MILQGKIIKKINKKKKKKRKEGVSLGEKKTVAYRFLQ